MDVKIGLAVLAVLGAATSCGGETAEPQGLVLRVDRTWNGVPSKPGGTLSDSDYQETEPRDRYAVKVTGNDVEVTPLEPSAFVDVMRGRLARESDGARSFELDDGLPAGGRFVVRGDEGELTIFGSGRPVVSSERGALVRR